VSDPSFRSLARKAASLYPARDRFARHFAFGKLKGDPVFEYLLASSLIAPGARVVDLGCGQGLLAALLVAAGVPVRYTGIELMAHDAERGRAATASGPADSMRFIVGDIRNAEFGAADAVVILDVLHYIDYEAQAAVLERVRDSLGEGGVLLLRVGDEAPTLRFRYTLFIDRMVMALRGRRISRLYCRPLARWVTELEGLGFKVEARPMSEGTMFANVLLVARYHRPG
jgi:SAM-dependent methyltransferase